MIIITQSRDLENNKNEFFALCPIYKLEEFEAGNQEPRERFLEQVRQTKLKVFICFSRLKIMETTANV